jgi:hypothetical protein
MFGLRGGTGGKMTGICAIFIFLATTAHVLCLSVDQKCEQIDEDGRINLATDALAIPHGP